MEKIFGRPAKKKGNDADRLAALYFPGQPPHRCRFCKATLDTRLQAHLHSLANHHVKYLRERDKPSFCKGNNELPSASDIPSSSTHTPRKSPPRTRIFEPLSPEPSVAEPFRKPTPPDQPQLPSRKRRKRTDKTERTETMETEAKSSRCVEVIPEPIPAINGLILRCGHNDVVCAEFPMCMGAGCSQLHPPCPELPNLCLRYDHCPFEHPHRQKTCDQCPSRHKPPIRPVAHIACPHVKTFVCTLQYPHNGLQCPYSHGFCEKQCTSTDGSPLSCPFEHRGQVFFCQECLTRTQLWRMSLTHSQSHQ